MSQVEHKWPAEAAALEDMEGLMAAVRRADEALVHDDHATALDATAPELLANVPGGHIIDKAILALALQHNMITYDRYERVIERVVRRETGEFVLMGSEEVTPKSTNQRLSEGGVERRRFTEIWRCDDGRWLLCIRHAG
ncbi:MAG: nuclear transport factor 2 family protein [Alphaproteobacteria bacterium]|nr:nuclear transport factor 2 family protein [Alphaproteobacteria bacterium]